MMNEKSFELIFVRHAQSFGNVDDEWPAGFHEDDPPLTPLGIKHAELLAERLASENIGRIFCSTLIRTAQTVQPTAEKLGKKAIMLPDLMEVETTVSGTPFDVAASLAPDAVYFDADISPLGGGRFLGEESVADLENRGNRCVEYFKSIAENGEKLVICSHAAFFGYLIRPALGLSLPESFNIKIENCSVTTVRYRPGKLPLLVGLNDKSHLK